MIASCQILWVLETYSKKNIDRCLFCVCYVIGLSNSGLLQTSNKVIYLGNPTRHLIKHIEISVGFDYVSIVLYSDWNKI